jgi:hypothetical protein
MHVSDDNPWARWVWRMVGDRPISALAGKDLLGEHWKALCTLVPLYRSISKVELGDGARSGFWLDEWLSLGALNVAMPALYSHATNVYASVRVVLRSGLSTALIPRLTAVAEGERRRLGPLLDAMHLTSAPDVRVLTRCRKTSGGLRSTELYKLVCFGGVQAPLASFVWGCHAPARVKFFGWLLSLGRIKTRDTLLHKNILAQGDAGCPLCPIALETAQHLVFGCPFAQGFWASVGVVFCPGAVPDNMMNPACHPGIPERSAATFLLLCCWQLWKHRNGVVFNGDSPSLPAVRSKCRDDATFWRARLSATAKDDVDIWLGRLQG